MILWLLLSATLVGATAIATPRGTRHIHLNNAGDSPCPPAVTDAIVRHIHLESELGGYRAAELADVDRVYDSVARLIGAGRCVDGDGEEHDVQGYNAREEVALVESATVGWTRAFYSMLETKERELMVTPTNIDGNDAQEKNELVILVSEAEYAANLVAAVKWARDRTQSSRFRWRVFPIPSSTLQGKDDELVSTGVVDLGSFRSMLEGTYAIDSGGRYLDPASIVMVCITHIPTNSGIINPVNEIGAMIDEFNCRGEGNSDETLPQTLYLVDVCQSVGQIPVHVREMKCHALAATGRKYVRGPRGTGFLYVPSRIANLLEPSHVDHAAAPVLNVVDTKAWMHGLEGEEGGGLCHTYQPGAARFEFWEASVATRLGLGAAIDVSLSTGMEANGKKCASLGRMLRQKLETMDCVHVYHGDSSACGIVTFYVDTMDATIIKERMQRGLCKEGSKRADEPFNCYHLSVVPATSTPLDSSCTGLGERSLIRASLSYFNTEEEIVLFCQALECITRL